MTDQEYTMRRDMLRDAIRKTQSELDGLKEELATLEETHKPYFTETMVLSEADFKVFSHGCQVERVKRGVTVVQYAGDQDLKMRLQKDVLDIWRSKNGMPKITGRLVSITPDSQNVGQVIMGFEK